MPFAPLTSTPERTTAPSPPRSKEVAESAHLVDISAAPLENNLFEWHGNLWFGDAPLHFALFFPDSYPSAPPTCALASRLPHPNVTRAGPRALRVVALPRPPRAGAEGRGGGALHGLVFGLLGALYPPPASGLPLRPVAPLHGRLDGGGVRGDDGLLVRPLRTTAAALHWPPKPTPAAAPAKRLIRRPKAWEVRAEAPEAPRRPRRRRSPTRRPPAWSRRRRPSHRRSPTRRPPAWSRRPAARDRQRVGGLRRADGALGAVHAAAAARTPRRQADHPLEPV